MPPGQDDKQKMLPNMTGRRLSKAVKECKGFIISKATHNIPKNESAAGAQPHLKKIP
jgi:hypothetical protein